jgi:phosphoglycolate phosphatase-like HAD superfamily hydrolase
MLAAACAELGVETRRLLYIGDSSADIAAARALKCRIVAVNYGYSAYHELVQAEPDDIVGSLTDVIELGLRSRSSAPQLKVVS